MPLIIQQQLLFDHVETKAGPEQRDDTQDHKEFASFGSLIVHSLEDEPSLNDSFLRAYLVRRLVDSSAVCSAVRFGEAEAAAIVGPAPAAGFRSTVILGLGARTQPELPIAATE